VRIGIVTSLAAAADVLRRVVALRDHRVVWVAANGADAVACCARDTPDLVLIDVLRSGNGGVDATRRIMARTPCAILLVTASTRVQADHIVEAMGHGALDAVDAPILTAGDLHDVAAPVLEKIDRMSLAMRGRQASGVSHEAREGSGPRTRDWLVAIGASAGGPAVLTALLRQLPKDFAAAIVIVQHVDRQFVDGMAAWLNEDSALPVRVAEEGDRPIAGSVLIAGRSEHLTFKTADRLGYTTEPVDEIHRPSVDVFFRSIGRWWPGEAIGVLLTGMGRDGAVGLKVLRDRGYHTIAQDEATSAVYGMPKAAARLHAAVEILPADCIAPALMEILICRKDGPPT
jgi:two-component system response regulator WspF